MALLKYIILTITLAYCVQCNTVTTLAPPVNGTSTVVPPAVKNATEAEAPKVRTARYFPGGGGLGLGGIGSSLVGGLGLGGIGGIGGGGHRRGGNRNNIAISNQNVNAVAGPLGNANAIGVSNAVAGGF